MLRHLVISFSLIGFTVACSDSTVVPEDATPQDATVDSQADAFVGTEPDYSLLSETGLYSNISTKTVAAGIIEFTPDHVLWSDGADKRRWVYIPPGEQIDTSDMDNWIFPVGTKIWKEFTRDEGGVIFLETRLTEKWGPNPGEIWMSAFIWRGDEADADIARFGGMNVNGTTHDVPSANDCIECHQGQLDRVLGFGAIQLSHSDANNIDTLRTMGLFGDEPQAGGYPAPGNATEAAALGYLHANCGHCHHSTSTIGCWTLTNLDLRLYVGDTATTAAAYTGTVNQPLQHWTPGCGCGNPGTLTTRVVPGDAANSALVWRADVRGASEQMPPRFTEDIDDTGVTMLRNWVNAM